MPSAALTCFDSAPESSNDAAMLVINRSLHVFPKVLRSRGRSSAQPHWVSDPERPFTPPRRHSTKGSSPQLVDVASLVQRSASVHRGSHVQPEDWPEEFGPKPRHPLLEGQVVDLADSTAYNKHDIEDGLSAGMFTEQTIEAEVEGGVVLDGMDARRVITVDSGGTADLVGLNITNGKTTQVRARPWSALSSFGPQCPAGLEPSLRRPHEVTDLPFLVTDAPDLWLVHRQSAAMAQLTRRPEIPKGIFKLLFNIRRPLQGS